MRWLVLAGAMLALASTAGAAEVGECTPQRHAPCLFHELAPPNNVYTDGHPDVLLDEKQSFVAAGFDLECKGSVVEGEVTGFTTNRQLIHLYHCALSKGPACGNVGPEQIDTALEEGEYVNGPGTVRNRLTLSASFSCAGIPATLEGTYEGTIEPSRVGVATRKYDLEVGAGLGAQAITGTYGLEALGSVTMTGEQEDKFPTSHVVVRP